MNSHRVLLVDDEPALRLALRKWFERQGWAVDEAPDGMTANHRLTAMDGDYSLILCDVNLPVLNGVQVASHIESEWPELLSRFVFTTGDTLEFTPEKRSLRERTHLLLKPFEFSSLHTLVERVSNTNATAA